MKRQLLVPDDIKHYRWLLNLDNAFEPAPLPRGFDYEAQIDKILEIIWSPQMTNVLGIDIDRFHKTTKMQIVQQKRDLLDVALNFGPLPQSRSFLSATDILLYAENTGQNPVDVRSPAKKALPGRLFASDGIEVWCGASAAVPADIALVLSDIDLSHHRVQAGSEASIRARSLAGPRLTNDCALLKRFFDADFQAGSVVLTRGYFSASRYLVHAVPPIIDNGIWKNTLAQVQQCYEGFWHFVRRVKAKRIAVQMISLGSRPDLQERSQAILLNQIERFADDAGTTVCLVAHTTAASAELTDWLEDQRRAERRRGGGFLPARNTRGDFSPGSLGANNAAVLIDKTAARRSSKPTVGFSKDRSSRLT